MPTDFPISDLLPQPIVDHLEQLRQTRKLGSIRDALIVALAEFFDDQNLAAENSSQPSTDSSSEIATIQKRLSHLETMVLALASKFEQVQPLPAKLSTNVPLDLVDDDIEDEPDEILYSFLPTSPINPPNSITSQAVPLGQNLGWSVQASEGNSSNRSVNYEDVEDEPDEILSSFLESEPE